MDTSVGLGLVLSRAEEASLAWGRPLDQFEPDTAVFDPDVMPGWFQRHSSRFMAYNDQVVLLRQPFEGVPSIEEGAWWLWWFYSVLGEPGADWVEGISATDQLGRVQRAIASGQLLPSAPWPWWLDDFVAVGAELTRKDPGLVLHALVSDDGQVGRDAVPPLRALVTPQLGPADRSWLQTRAALGRTWFTRARLSSLSGNPGRHAELMAAAPPDLLLRTWKAQDGRRIPFFSWPGLVDVLGAMPDRDSAVGFFERGPSVVDDPKDCEIPLESVPLVLAILGERVLPLLLTHIVRITDRWEQACYVALLADRLHGPGAVPAMVELASRRRLAAPVGDWLVAHPQAISGCTAEFGPAGAAVIEAAVGTILDQDDAAFGAEIANPTVQQIIESRRDRRSTAP